MLLNIFHNSATPPLLTMSSVNVPKSSMTLHTKCNDNLSLKYIYITISFNSGYK